MKLSSRIPPVVLKRTAALVAAGIIAVLSTCSPRVPVLQQVLSVQVLRVATLNSPTTYYQGPGGPTGFEYDLALGFAGQLGTDLEILTAETPGEVLDLVRLGRAHLAAGVSITPARDQLARFTPPMRSVQPQLVYRVGNKKPRTLYEIDQPLVVPSGSAAAELMGDLSRINPDLRWTESPNDSAEQLLVQVANKELAYTIAPSDLVAINRRYSPSLRVAFSLADPQHVGWAFRRGDDSLFDAALNFIDHLDRKELVNIRDRHFGHVSHVGSYGALMLATHAQTRLPRYREAFEEAGKRYGIDWRLLAAVGYQESRWDPGAVSPTGVRGIMQITNITAEFLNLADRLDPIQSIPAAAHYLQQLHARLPDSIPEPDRTWMTLASYNIGTGHLMDARVLARQNGANPDSWVEVRAQLPLLTQSKWHRKTRYGYARGHEALTYVGNIRTYYDILTWLTGGLQPDSPMEDDAPVEDEGLQKEPLNIRSPIL